MKILSRKAQLAALFTLGALAFTACQRGEDERATVHTVLVGDGPVQVMFPKGWKNSTKEHPYDTQWFSAHEDLTTGIFFYRDEDPAKVFAHHYEDLKGKRSNIKPVAPKKVSKLGTKTITSVAFSGDKNGETFNYRVTAISFHEHPELCLVTVQVALPEVWESKRQSLELITLSAWVNPSKLNQEGSEERPR